MSSFRIGDRRIGADEPTYVIAEAGLNHDGDLGRAKALVDAAADADADAVKFQTFRADQLYQETAPEDGASTLETFQSLEMPADWIPELAAYAGERGVDFLSTPFDEASVEALADHVPAFKIASSTLSDHRFLRQVASVGKPLICSTGIHTREEIGAAVDVLEETGTPFVLLHCVSSYPTPLDAINVSMVSALREWFDVLTGLSDHTEDPTTAPTAAVARGAAVVEKHITTDSSREGADHAMALEPPELRRMVTAIRRTETALGTPYEDVPAVERGAYENARRGIYALADIEAGERLTEENVGIRRADGRERGLEPGVYDAVLGKQVDAPLERLEPLTETHVSL